jgi:effector-binding domain-containing protein
MFKKIAYLIVIIFFLLLVIGLYLPRSVHVERSIDISRPAPTVFTLLNGFRTFSAWSPWSERDPETVYETSGPIIGPGARLNWSGDPRLVGSGWQEIIDSKPWSMVRMSLEFDQMGPAISTFQIDPYAAGVHLTWGFEMDLAQSQGFFDGIMMRYFGLFFEGWIGTDYETGLTRFKAYVESLPAADFSDLDVAVVQVQPLDILYVSLGQRESAGGIEAGLAAAYREITALMAQQSIEIQSQPLVISRAWDAENYEFDAAIPISPTQVELTGQVQYGKSPGGPAVRVVHHGAYNRMPASYAKLAAYMAAHGLKEGRVSWEQYISNPGETESGEAITHIYFLIEDDTSE